MKRFHIISLFPDSMKAYLSESILGRAEESKLISVKYYNPRDFTEDKWKRVDRRPYAGGPGMVLEPESLLKAAMKAKGKHEKRVKFVFFATDGKLFTNKIA